MTLNLKQATIVALLLGICWSKEGKPNFFLYRNIFNDRKCNNKTTKIEKEDPKSDMTC